MARRSLLQATSHIEWRVSTPQSNAGSMSQQLDALLATSLLTQKLQKRGFDVSSFTGGVAQAEDAIVRDVVEVIDPDTGTALQDTEPPFIVLRGNADVEMPLAAAPLRFVDAGASAIDQIDGDVSAYVRSRSMNGTVMELTRPTELDRPYVIRYAKLAPCDVDAQLPEIRGITLCLQSAHGCGGTEADVIECSDGLRACRYTVADSAGNSAVPVYRRIHILSPCSATEVWCPEQVACSFNGVCSDEAAELAALSDDASADTFDAYANQYEADDSIELDTADTEPPLIRVETAQVRTWTFHWTAGLLAVVCGKMF